jgi:alkanesulfonate monooxygenase SsuD/methylene tetrahydromethanopterin reductase-like flavin-dependent oxidoreductase (luciferase family)
MKRTVKFGAAFDFRIFDPAKHSPAKTYRFGVERAVLAEELGFDYFVMGEHHFSDDGMCPSPFLVFSAVAARTTKLRFATYVFLLPLHHPLRVAEDMAVLDALSGGRVELGVGAGYRLEEFAGLGVDRRTRGVRMEEGIQILLDAWNESGVSSAGRAFSFDEVAVTPQPPVPPRLWCSARNEVSARRAARFRLPLMIAPAPYVEDARVVYSAYADQLREQGDDPADYDVFGQYMVEVDETEAVQPPSTAHDVRLEKYAEWYSEGGDIPGDRERILAPHPDLQRQIGVKGSPARCIEGLEWMLDQVPFTHLVVSGLSEQQMRRFSAEVAPSFTSRDED